MDKFKPDKLTKTLNEFVHKKDESKTDFYLLDMDAIEGMAEVFTHVSNSGKYENFSWQMVEPRRYFASFMRHMIKHRKAMVTKAPEDFLDDETNLPHIDHAMCCLMILRWNATNGGKHAIKKV